MQEHNNDFRRLLLEAQQKERRDKQLYCITCHRITKQAYSLENDTTVCRECKSIRFLS